MFRPVQKRLVKGEKPFIDPRYKERSVAERVLVRVLQRSWAFNPDDRITIFEALQRLEQAIVQSD